MTESKKGTPEASNIPVKAEAGKLSTHKGIDPIIQKAQAYIERLQSEAGFVFPPNYNPGNALMGAKMHLMELEDKNGKLIIDQVTPTSVLNAMIEMVQKGLSVVKNQCYFVKYGDKLEMEEDYRGKLMIAKRDAEVKDCVGQVIYKGDVFEFVVDTVTGRKHVTKHEPRLENQKAENIIGAYAVVTFIDGTNKAEVMTMDQIRTAWGQGGARGESPAHKKFPDQMAIKTVMNRAIKVDTGSSDDSEILQDLDPLQAERDKKIRESRPADKKSFGTDVDFEEMTPPVKQQSNVEAFEDARANSTVTDGSVPPPEEDPYK